MTNLKLSRQGDTLTITIDLKAEGVPSSSGKSLIIASTNGNAQVSGTDLKLGLNLYRPVR
jgi:hypothetical protein